MGKKTVSLVLSSGGARGMAHIGAIEALEEAGYEIVSIAGCSAGALVGGMYATGNLPKFKEWICNLDKIDVFSLMDFTFSSRGFIKGERVFGELKKLIVDCQIEELDIPFYCTAVEIPKGNEKVFNKGSLYDAIRASVSIPSIFTPAKLGKYEYIDGSILNPLPFDIIPEHELGEILVAVDLNGPKEAFVKIEKPKEKESLQLPSWMKVYKKKVSQYFKDEGQEEKYKGMGFIDLLNYSFDLLQDKLSALVLEKHSVDIVIEIARNQAGTLDFDKASELIQIGKEKMIHAIQAFEHGHQST